MHTICTYLLKRMPTNLTINSEALQVKIFIDPGKIALPRIFADLIIVKFKIFLKFNVGYKTAVCARLQLALLVIYTL